MKQIYMLRNEEIRNNAIDAILSLPIDDKSPHEVHVKEPSGVILKTALCGRYCRTYHVRCFGMERDLRRRTGKICSLPCGLRQKNWSKEVRLYRRWRCHAWRAYQQNAKGQHD